MSTLDHPSVAKVVAALTDAGQHTSAEEIRILPAEVRTAAQAAEALGIEVGAIANSLVFRCRIPDAEDRPLLVLTSGAHRADTDTLAALVDATEVVQADPEFVKHHTGQSIGGVAPVGHPRKLVTLVDVALDRYDMIWAAAGHPKSVFPTTFDAMLQLTDGRAAEVAAESAAVTAPVTESSTR